MLLRPLQQEGAFMALIIWVVPVVFLAIGVFLAGRASGEGIARQVPRVLGWFLGGFPLGVAMGAMITSTYYTYPESYLGQGFLVGLGVTLIALGDAVSERVGAPPRAGSRFKATHWILMNAVPAAGISYLLSEMNWVPDFIPAITLVVSACQWLYLKEIFPVSPWWLITVPLASIGTFTYPSGNLALGFYGGGILMVAAQYLLLRRHHPRGALWYAGISLLSMWAFGSLLDYIPGNRTRNYNLSPDFYVEPEMLLLSFYGLVITWSSVLVGVVAARALRPVEEPPAVSAAPEEAG